LVEMRGIELLKAIKNMNISCIGSTS